ncbi:MAG: hypothetical protein LBC20_13520 [Planctomycetaceae bacterium]|jgi:hypothetical protein|nr:hypothetical protein [Planctomycetaceae bacterium]
MTLNDPAENTTPISVTPLDIAETNQAGLSVPTGAPDEFFDRERWHDVEFDNGIQQDEPVVSKKLFPYLFSVAILFLVIVIAGACGIYAAYYLSLLMHEPALPEPDYRNVPAQWIGYVEDSVFFCEVNNPLCFAGDGLGKFYIGDENPPSICEFSIKTKLLRTIPLPSRPMALTIGNSEQLFAGQLIVAHSDRIAVYSMDGELRFSWYLPNTKSAVWSLAVTGDAVFAADTGQCVVYQFDEKGTLLKTLGQPLAKKTTQNNNNNNNSGLESIETFPRFSVYLSPMSLAVSRKTGLIHVTNPGQHRVETFTPDGYWEPSLSWGNASGDLAGFVGCCNPVSITTLENGQIVTAEKFVTRVKVFYSHIPKGSSRRLDCVVAGPEVLDKQPPNIPQLASFHLPASETGRPIFVTALGNDVIVFDPVMRVLRYFTAIHHIENTK